MAVSALCTPAVSSDPAWPVTDHTAAPVLDLLAAQGWELVATPEANVHATSPDGRVHVAWLPEDPDAWSRDIVFRVRVASSDGPTWTQEFGTDTPPITVAGFLAALITASR